MSLVNYKWLHGWMQMDLTPLHAYLQFACTDSRFDFITMQLRCNRLKIIYGRLFCCIYMHYQNILETISYVTSLLATWYYSGSVDEKTLASSGRGRWNSDRRKIVEGKLHRDWILEAFRPCSPVLWRDSESNLISYAWVPRFIDI